jgi:hypothetical protein
VIIRALRFSPDGHSPPGATFSDRRLQQFERNEEIFDFGPGVVLRVGLTR